MLPTELIMRASDIQELIKDYKSGLCTECEFVRMLAENAAKIIRWQNREKADAIDLRIDRAKECV